MASDLDEEGSADVSQVRKPMRQRSRLSLGNHGADNPPIIPRPWQAHSGESGSAAMPEASETSLEHSGSSRKSVAFLENEVPVIPAPERKNSPFTVAARPPPPPAPANRGHHRSKSAGGALGTMLTSPDTDRLSWPCATSSLAARETRHASDGAESVVGLTGESQADDDSTLLRRPSNLITQDEIDFFRSRRSEGKSTEEMHSAIARLRRRNRSIQDVNAQMQHELSRVKASRLYLEKMLSEQVEESQ